MSRINPSNNLHFSLSFFMAPLLISFAIVLAASKPLSHRFDRISLSRICGLMNLAISNGIFLIANGIHNPSPLGTLATWPDLWLFGFLPASAMLSIVMSVLIDHIHESEPAGRHH